MIITPFYVFPTGTMIITLIISKHASFLFFSFFLWKKLHFFHPFHIYYFWERKKTISSLFSLLWHQYVAAVPYILFFCHACAAWLERDRARAPTCQVSGRIVVNTHSLVMEALIRLAKPCHPPSLSPTSTFHFFPFPPSPQQKSKYLILFCLGCKVPLKQPTAGPWCDDSSLHSFYNNHAIIYPNHFISI